MAKDALFEIGLEELPARFIDDAANQLTAKTKKWLEELRISYDSISSYSTPRRLAILIHGMAEEQTAVEEEVKGPAVKIARNADGEWTKAAIGFTKGQGKTTDDIYTKDIKGTSYIFVKKYIEGNPTIKLLPAFRDIVLSLQFPKNMHWGTETLRFARPIRWLVALYGSEVVPFTIAHVQSDNETYGHRFLGGRITLTHPAEYIVKLAENFVIADPAKREKLITDGIKKMENEKGLQIPIDPDLLEEVRNLVEYPTVFIGEFADSFLDLPPEVLITSMKEHQRYFPVKSPEGNLLPYFIGVRNGDIYQLETVAKGNEKVLKARLADAQFFYEEDQKHPIDFYLQKLNKVVFQDKLGTIHDKVERVIQITKEIAETLKLDDTSKQKAVRAAEISKFDLMTNMVNEFTELQGIMGEKYAINFGEDETVAKAIAEHYLPRHATDQLPETIEGAIVSVADKLDTIVGCISVGLVPTGSQDPYGLRRQAVGMLKILQSGKWKISVEQLLNIALKLYQSLDIEQGDIEKTAMELHEFLALRATYLLKEANIEIDIIQAVLSKAIGVVDYTIAKAGNLSEKRNQADFKQTEEAFTRVLNLAKKAESTAVESRLFETPSETFLYKKFKEVQAGYQQAKDSLDAEQALLQLSGLTEEIHNFFEHNMVMADNEAVRNNRLALLHSLAALIYDYADMTQISWKQHF
ncbi:glycine--tRNA ligase subunit beta [Virgibacillus dakarensis]|uniref:Glycine--tRNA ligase beta subunit n=1 Tax=Lentibacillus populi TaxID=1827502 RepID=A0A9W5TU95_9BACI|nr:MULTISPECIES: glycine--tRNA ligase subunit beta [Bacillaceae]MBT2214492.1 glycine--tRNA ligase subunit beta [Virgibacillus dakarensis]MTW84097.1 glycine--tRNA ligase subunit beta [Virgibacillus dakarensis]GGB29116.1 glycine--tRNA ligase beta subunit [Lentibacillus populi]